MKTSFDGLDRCSLLTRQEIILKRVMDQLRLHRCYYIQGHYTDTQRFFGAGRRWQTGSDREAYYICYHLLVSLRKPGSLSKIPKKAKT